MTYNLKLDEREFEIVLRALVNDKNYDIIKPVASKYDNVNDFVKAQNVITEHISKNQKNHIVENKLTSTEFENKIEEVEKEITENINQEEKTLLDRFLTNKKQNKKEVFENYKRKTLRKIREMIENSEDSDKSQWNKIYENVSSKNFSENMSENITNCAEMMEICSTIDE